jgi:DNA-directed RNA polymerase sigma subunit (sigma70/sigma32)
MKTLMRFAQSNYELKKELNGGVIHIPSNHRELEYEYVGLEEIEMFPSESSEFRGFEIEDMGIELNRVMGSLLTPKERCVIEMSFGLLSYEEMNYNEIGRELQVGYEMARKIKNRAMDKLKNYFTNNL